MMKNKNIRKLTVTGQNASYYVTIPKDMIRELCWRKGQKLVVELEGDKVVLTDWKR